MKKSIIILLLITTASTIFAQKHWESIVLASDLWRYLPATSEPPSGWFQQNFNDSGWQMGQGGFGYGDNDDTTVIPASNSVYIRRNFLVQVPSIIERILLDVDYDDAFVCYINGVEVARSSNITANPPLFNSLVTQDREANLFRGMLPERVELKTSVLRQGVNTIAVQILNFNLQSSDMSAAVFLHGYINSSNTIFKPVPSWFTDPVDFSEFDLPLLLIDTEGQTIVDEPKITAKMKVLNSPTGINKLNDTEFEFDGHIGIEIRGSSSQMFEKKGYRVETRNPMGENFNVSLLGMPHENDWVLHGPYSDKSLMRNALAYHFGNLMGRWSPRTRFCEVFINNEYRGVYVLTEVIKIDRNRLNLAKLKPTDASGDALTGGYVLKIDRPDPGYWVSPFRARNNQQTVPISYVDPTFDELTQVQRDYIRNHVTNFETALWGNDFKDPVKGYRNYIDIQSFVDYYILNEISRNLDANRVSTFFYKDRNSINPNIIMGPFWDYNIAFGNANFFSAGQTAGWVVDGVGNGDAYGITFWWDKFRTDSFFEFHLRNRWNVLRNSTFSLNNFNRFIDSCATVLSNAQHRNFQKFKVLNTYVWPNNYIGGSYLNEVNYLKNWIRDRLAWMDSQIALISGVELVELQMAAATKAYPNPFSNQTSIYFTIETHATAKLILSDMMGREITRKTLDAQPGTNEITLTEEDFSTSSGRIFTYRILCEGKMLGSGKLIRN